MEQYLHVAKGLDPVADAFDTAQYSDVYSMRRHGHITFVIYKGVGTTGTSTITVEACDDVTPSNTSAIAFKYQAVTTGDTYGAMTDATSAGFTTTAGSSQLYKVEVDATALLASGYGFIRCKATEVVNSPVVGCIFAIMTEPRDEKAVQATVIA
jgi:hypothetical protein